MEAHNHEGSQGLSIGACGPTLREAKESVRCRQRVLYHTHFTGHNLDSPGVVPCTISPTRLDRNHHAPAPTHTE